MRFYTLLGLLLLSTVFGIVICKPPTNEAVPVEPQTTSKVNVTTTLAPDNKTTTAVPPVTTLKPNVTTISPNSTTEAPTTTTVITTTSTEKSTTTNKPTTTPPVPPTSPPPNPQPTTGPTTTAQPGPAPSPSTGRHFDGLSFMGGIILTTCLVGLSVGTYKFYKIKTERSYRTL